MYPDQAAEIGDYDAGEGQGAEEAGERGHPQREASSAKAVWFESTGAAGMHRSPARHRRETSRPRGTIPLMYKQGPCVLRVYVQRQHETTGGSASVLHHLGAKNHISLM